MEILKRKGKPVSKQIDQHSDYGQYGYDPGPAIQTPVNLDKPHVTPTPPRVQYMQGQQFDEVIATVEEELSMYRPKPATTPMPDYVEPRNGVPPVGALSAEALVKDYEKTAKGIDAMAAELMEATNRCAHELIELTQKFQQMSDNIRTIVDHVKETSASYRDEAKTMFVRIEDATMRMQEVRDLSDAMRQRLAESTESGKIDDH